MLGQMLLTIRFTAGEAVIPLVAEQGGALRNGLDQRFSFARNVD